MTLKFGFQEHSVEPGASFYLPEEYSLWYETNLKPAYGCQVLLIYNTLHFTFDLIKKNFISFDDFTNNKQWTLNNEIKVPKVQGSGLLKIHGGEEEDTDRYSMHNEVSYEFSEKDKILKMKLSNEMDEGEFFLISQNLIVEIKNEQLHSLTMLKLHIVH